MGSSVERQGMIYLASVLIVPALARGATTVLSTPDFGSRVSVAAGGRLASLATENNLDVPSFVTNEVDSLSARTIVAELSFEREFSNFVSRGAVALESGTLLVTDPGPVDPHAGTLRRAHADLSLMREAGELESGWIGAGGAFAYEAERWDLSYSGTLDRKHVSGRWFGCGLSVLYRDESNVAANWTLAGEFYPVVFSEWAGATYGLARSAAPTAWYYLRGPSEGGQVLSLVARISTDWEWRIGRFSLRLGGQVEWSRFEFYDTRLVPCPPACSSPAGDEAYVTEIVRGLRAGIAVSVDRRW